MPADVGEAQGARPLDQQAEHAAPPWQAADLLPFLLADPVGDEALEFVAVLVEDAERGVAGAGQLAGDLEQAAEDDLRVELGDEAAADLDQLAQASLVERFAVIPLRHATLPLVVGTQRCYRGWIGCSNSVEQPDDAGKHRCPLGGAALR